MARGALCHVDVAGEQGVGEARDQPAAELYDKLEQAASNKKMESNCLIFDVHLSDEREARKQGGKARTADQK